MYTLHTLHAQERAVLQLLVGLPQLVARVHHDRTPERDRLAQRRPTQQQHVARLGVGGIAQRHRVTVALKERAAARLHRHTYSPMY
eukprot:scaffold90767_cov78-Phaeocystis_antarctica.AAC.1